MSELERSATSHGEPSERRTTPPRHNYITIGEILRRLRSIQINGTVTFKSKIMISNPQSQNFFCFEIIEGSEEMRGMVFDKDVTTFYDKLDVGKMYKFRNVYFNATDPVSPNKDIEYEFILRDDSIVEIFEEGNMPVQYSVDPNGP